MAARPGFATEFKNISHKCYLVIILTCLQESGDSKKIGEVYYIVRFIENLKISISTHFGGFLTRLYSKKV